MTKENQSSRKIREIMSSLKSIPGFQYSAAVGLCSYIFQIKSQQTFIPVLNRFSSLTKLHRINVQR